MKLLVIIYFFTCLNTLVGQDLEKMRKFADELFNDAQYYRAITEYQRINSYFPKNSYYIENLQQIAFCYSKNFHYVESNKYLYQILALDSLNWWATFNIAKNLNSMSFYYESNTFLNKNNKFKHSKLDTLRLLSAINYIYLDEYKMALGELNKINNSNSLILKATKYQEIVNNSTPLKFKSKTKSILLGIVPGLGYLYAGKEETAISAFFVNLLFGYATYSLFKNKEKGLGLTLSIITSGFYFGSIYGSIEAVNDYNRNLKISFTQQFYF